MGSADSFASRAEGAPAGREMARGGQSAARHADNARLGAIRRRVAMVDAAEWQLAADGDGMGVMAHGRDGSLVTILRFTGHATPEEMELAAGALDDARFLLRLLDAAFSKIREAAPKPAGERLPDAGDLAAAREKRDGRPKNHAAEAAMLCGSPAFKRWLMELHGLESPATDDRTAARLRSLLGVTSRKQINETEAVRDRWLALRRDFYAWKGRVVA